VRHQKLEETMVYHFRILLLGFMLAVPMSAASAGATIFTLGNWNTTELQTSLDTVTVIAGSGISDGFACQTNQICVHWNDGAGTSTPTVKAIISFAYDDGNVGTSAPSTTTESGGSTAWSFNGAGNADGFGAFERNNDKGNGNENTAGTANWLVLTLNDDVPSDLSSWDLAAHVQYNGGCSGWVSDRTHPNPGSNADCDPSSVPEPSAMVLFGFGLVGLGAWRRKRLG
jgi:PEP-CTERM motif